MTKILGTNVAASIVPFTTDDFFATHLAKYGQGGWREVATIEERDAITEARREAGMAVFVLSEKKTYILDEDLTTWYEFKTDSADSIRKTNDLSGAGKYPYEIVQYIGTTNLNYVQGYFYQYVKTIIPSTATITTNSGNETFVNTLSVDKATFESYLGPTQNLTLTFTFDGESWSLNGEIVDIALYGVSYEGTPISGDTATITYKVEKVTEQWNQINVQPQIDIIDSTKSSSTTAALSANQGKILQNEINSLSARGHYLALWDGETGLSDFNPPTSPYYYQSGDYYVVGNVIEEPEPSSATASQTYGISLSNIEVDVEDLENYFELYKTSELCLWYTDFRAIKQRSAPESEASIDVVDFTKFKAKFIDESNIVCTTDPDAVFIGLIVELYSSTNDQGINEKYIEINRRYRSNTYGEIDELSDKFYNFDERVILEEFFTVFGLSVAGETEFAPLESGHDQFMIQDNNEVDWTYCLTTINMGETGVTFDGTPELYDEITVLYTEQEKNLRPDEREYRPGIPSYTKEYEKVNINDTYIYDGDVWHLLKNSQKEVAFVAIDGDPYDNDALAEALYSKQDVLSSENAGEGIDITIDRETGKPIITNTNSTSRWGSIIGNISDQDDLSDALDGKVDHYKSMPRLVKENVGRIAQYIGDTTEQYINGFFYKYTAFEVDSHASGEQTFGGDNLQNIDVDVVAFEIAMDDESRSEEVVTHPASGDYVFTYNGSSWVYDNEPVDIAAYGITYTGEAKVHDQITVTYAEPMEDYEWRQINVQPHTIVTDRVRKVDTLPTTPEIENEIVEYIGTTNEQYTRGYFYEHKNGQTTANASYTGSALTNVVVNAIQFSAAVNNTEGTYVFTYNQTLGTWYYTVEGSEQQADFTEFGIVYEGTPDDNDVLEITLAISLDKWTQIDVQPDNQSADEVEYHNEAVASVTNVQEALDKLMNFHYYANPTGTFDVTNVPSGIQEIGSTINAPFVLSWNLTNRTPASNDTGYYKFPDAVTHDTLAKTGSDTYNTDITSTTNNAKFRFEYYYKDNNAEVPSGKTNIWNPSKTITFGIRRFWGVTSTETLPDVDLTTILSSEIETSRTQARKFDCTGGKYWWIVIPTAWTSGIKFVQLKDDLKTVVADITLNPDYIYTRTITNQYGVETAYTLYRVEYMQRDDSVCIGVQ